MPPATSAKKTAKSKTPFSSTKATGLRAFFVSTGSEQQQATPPSVVEVIDLNSTEKTDENEKSSPSCDEKIEVKVAKSLFPLFSAKKKPSESNSNAIVTPESDEAQSVEPTTDAISISNDGDDDAVIIEEDDSPPLPKKQKVNRKRHEISEEDTPAAQREDEDEVVEVHPHPTLQSKAHDDEKDHEEEVEDNGRRRSARIRSKPQYQAYYAEDGERQGDAENVEEEDYYTAFSTTKKRRSSVDSEVVETKEKKKKAVKKAAIFLSREEKAMKEAMEREQRIHEQMLKVKRENDQMLIQANNKGGTASLFLRPMAGAGKGEKSLGGKSDGASDFSAEVYMPPITVGVDSSILQNMAASVSFTLPDRVGAGTACKVGEEERAIEGMLGERGVECGKGRVDGREIWFRSSPSPPPYSLSSSPSVRYVSTAYAQARERLTGWLKQWVEGKNTGGAGAGAGEKKSKGRRGRGRGWYESDEESEEDSEGEGGLNSLFIVQGESGTGKSALVSEVSRDLGVEVIELNPSLSRGAGVVKRLVGEVSNTQNLGICTVLVLEEADILLDEDEQTFHATILKLSQGGVGTGGRCPIIITVTQVPRAFERMGEGRCEVVNLPKLRVGEMVKILGGMEVGERGGDGGGDGEGERGKRESALLLSIAVARDLRACRQMIALQYGGETLPLMSPTLEQWLEREGRDFSLFDSLLSLSSLSSSPSIPPRRRVFAPRIDFLSPSVLTPQGGQVRVRGEHLVQRGGESSLLPLLVLLDGHLPLSFLYLSAEEVLVTLPSLSPGLHSLSLRIELRGTGAGEGGERGGGGLGVSDGGQVRFLLISEGGETLPRYLQGGRSWGAVKASLCPPASKGGRGGRRRVGYASSSVCRRGLVLERKRFKGVRGGGGRGGRREKVEEEREKEEGKEEEGGDEEGDGEGAGEGERGEESEDLEEEEEGGEGGRERRSLPDLDSDAEEGDVQEGEAEGDAREEADEMEEALERLEGEAKKEEAALLPSLSPADLLAEAEDRGENAGGDYFLSYPSPSSLASLPSSLSLEELGERLERLSAGEGVWGRRGGLEEWGEEEEEEEEVERHTSSFQADFQFSVYLDLWRETLPLSLSKGEEGGETLPSSLPPSFPQSSLQPISLSSAETLPPCPAGEDSSLLSSLSSPFLRHRGRRELYLEERRGDWEAIGGRRVSSSLPSYLLLDLFPYLSLLGRECEKGAAMAEVDGGREKGERWEAGWGEEYGRGRERRRRSGRRWEEEEAEEEMEGMQGEGGQEREELKFAYLIERVGLSLAALQQLLSWSRYLGI